MLLEPKKQYLALDCEMTSLEADQGELLEAYFEVLDEKLNIVDSLKLNCKPEGNRFIVDPEAMAVNKIDLLKHSQTAKTYKEASYAFIEFLNRNTDHGFSKLTIVGQSCSTDIEFLKTKFKINRIEWENWMGRKILDTKRIADFLQFCNILDPTASTSLSSLSKRFNLPNNEKAHTAYDDVQHTKGVLVEFMKLTKQQQ